MQNRILIADDEPLARKRMCALLAPFAEEFEIVGEASSGEQTIEQINALNPDVVFLDIQMPDMDAFEVLRALNPEEDVPLIVFTTAYENFALRAFEENTVDYLLKPIEAERLQVTMEKLRKRLSVMEIEQQMPADFSWEKFRSMIDGNELYMQRVQVKIGGRILFVNVNEIVRFHSEEKYTTVYTLNNKYVIDTPLVDLEKRLDPHVFARIHRAHLVAIDSISEIRKSDFGRLNVTLNDKDHTQILVSRNFVKKVRNL